ncbi:MAG: hypothetical protein PHP85_13320 [Gallionella sp.]|nr:hypothetical protein [Gallionella sp.]
MKFIFRALLATLLFLPFVTWADTARAPHDYVIDVSGGKYVFVMLANSGFSPLDAGAPDDVGVIDADEEIRKSYKNSGLYLAGQTLPLWTISWYSFTVYPSADGDHLVRIGPWASSAEQLALAFYSGGVEIKKYLIRDLVKDQSRLHHTVSHFFWMSEHRYDEKNQLFHLKTVEGVSYKFSVMTGEIVP